MATSTTTFVTVQGDTVDLVAWKVTGRTEGVVEAILDANPGLAARGAALPLGTRVVVPGIAAPVDTAPTVSLWD